MNKILLVSPHFDDAILSAGQFMAERPDCEVVTIFAGFPPEPENVFTPYDEKCGFKNAEDAVAERQRENDRATSLLRATKIDLGFPDGQYGIKVTQEDISNRLQKMVDKNIYEAIYAPLGLGHPDHIKVTNAVLSLETDLPITLWEDLPLRVVEPELVADRINQLGMRYKPSRIVSEKSRMADKIRALMCYSSQVGTGILDPYVMFVPERFYNV